MSKKKKKSSQNHELKVKKIDVEKQNFNDREMEFVEVRNKDKDLKSSSKRKKHFFVDFCLVLLLLSSLGYFTVCLFLESGNNSLQLLSESLLLVLFSLVFVTISITSTRRRKGTILLSTLLLLAYFVLKITTTTNLIKFPSLGQVADFTGMSLTEVVEWAEANKIVIEQDYEYSDMVPEYAIISQNVKPGSKLKGTKEITVAVSEGANPYKEIIVPNMVSWDSERVLNFISENHLTNVDVEFIESDKAKDTVTEQSKSGNLKRNEEIKLTFSLGEEVKDEEVKLIDFTGKSKFEVMFYFKQHRIRYEFDEKFSKKIKRGFAVSQSVKAGSMVKVDDEKVKVSISKGPKIKVLDLKKMSVAEITEWVIKNKLKLEFTDRYDDSARDNEILEVNYSKGDVIEQGTTIKLVLSRGKLKMPKFKTLNEFREWADKYGIKYEEKYEFSDKVASGEVISYSYKTGEVIKNNDSIIVTISDGEKLVVPDLKDLTKGEVISKLKKLGLEYNFVYKSSSKIAKDKVISQSIAASSEVSKGTTITVTLSSGKETHNREEDKPSKDNNSGGSNNNNNNSGSSKPTPTPQPPSCEKKTYTIGRDLNNIFKQSGFSTVSSALYSFFASNYPNVKIRVVGVDGGDMTSGSYIGGVGPGSEVTSCNGVTYTIEIAK